MEAVPTPGPKVHRYFFGGSSGLDPQSTQPTGPKPLNKAQEAIILNTVAVQAGPPSIYVVRPSLGPKRYMYIHISMEI